jgi:hypothetical protein
MKYLKKFNELKSQTYTKAAKALQNLGHTRRASAMTDYVATVQERERIQKIKDNVDKYAHTGVFRASIVFEKWEGTNPNRTLTYVSPLKERDIEGEMTGNFHLAVWCDDDMFRDRLWDYVGGDNETWLNFTLGMVAADEETAEWFNTEDRGVKKWDFYWDGVYTPNRPYVKLTNDAGNFDPQPMGNENWENDRFVFEGRAEAMKFRKFMIDLFEGRVEMPYNPATTAKKAITALPTFDKVQAVRRILASNLPNNKFTDQAIKEMIVRFKIYTDGVTKLIDSSGGEWNRDDVTPEVVAKVTEEITAMIDEMTETQYRLFVDNSIKRLKVNDFYR